MTAPEVVTDHEGDAFDDPFDLDLGDDADYIDEIAVERRVSGNRTVALNTAEAFEAFSRLEVKGMSASEIAERLGVTQRTVVRWRNGHTDTTRLRGASTMTTPTTSPLALLLEQASAHGNKRVRRLAEKIEGHLSDLRTLITEDADREKQRQEVARLERQLAEAKAKLHGERAIVTRMPRQPGEADGRTTPMECRKCGQVCSGGQGRASHERTCTGAAVAS